MKRQGVPIIFEGLPESAPGFHNYELQNRELSLLLSEHPSETTPIQNIDSALEAAGILPETLVHSGLKFIRREVAGGKIYFLVNHTAKDIHSFVPLRTDAEEVLILDPLSRLYGKASIKKENEQTMVKVDMASGSSLFLKTGKTSNFPTWRYYRADQAAYPVEGEWQLSFLTGGPTIPNKTSMDHLGSWTALGEAEQAFSGTARYEIEFDAPDVEADNWELNLGDVRESAKVWLNGKFIGTAWAAPYTLKTGNLLKEKNTLVVEVTNLPANRIRAKELRGEEWKIFHEINMVDKDYNEFDATQWKPMPSGLLGEVTLTPLYLVHNH